MYFLHVHQQFECTSFFGFVSVETQIEIFYANAMLWSVNCHAVITGAAYPEATYCVTLWHLLNAIWFIMDWRVKTYSYII